MKKLFFLTLIFSATLVGFASKPPPQDPVPAPPPVTQPVPYGFVADWPNPEWTEIVSEALEIHGKDLFKTTPQDASTYGFKGGSHDSIKQFYIMLISSMVRYESSFRPSVNTYECRKTCVYEKCRYVEGRGYCMLGGHSLDGGLVISRGLLQISLQSAQGYGCPLKKPEELNDIAKNLTCGVIILNRWVAKDKMIGTSKKGGARYWAVLRESSDSRSKIIQKVKSKGLIPAL